MLPMRHSPPGDHFRKSPVRRWLEAFARLLRAARWRFLWLQVMACVIFGTIASWPLAWSMGNSYCLLSAAIAASGWNRLRASQNVRGSWVLAAAAAAAGVLASLALCCLLVVLLREVIVPVYSRLIYWSPGIDVLVPGHTPACDVESILAAALAKLRSGQVEFGAETPHWDAKHGHCDCASTSASPAGTCGWPEGGERMPTATIVHALVDLGRKRRSACDYLNFFLPHLMRNVSMVVYTEAWAMTYVQAVRKHMGLEAKTIVHLLQASSDKEGGIFYQLLPQMQEVGNRNFLNLAFTRSARGGRIVAKYSWVNHLKHELLHRVARENPFGTNFFVWMDAGAGHGNVRVPQNLCVCASAVPGTVTLFHRRSSAEELFEVGLNGLTEQRWKEWDFWNRELEEIMGTFFLGDAAGLELLWKDYYGLVTRLLRDGYSDHDQSMLAILAAARPSYMRFTSSGFWGVQDIC